MKKKKLNTLIVLALLAVSFIGLELPASAQSAMSLNGRTVRTDTRIEYHGGPLVTSTADVYFVWYGCWDSTCGAGGDPVTQSLVEDFTSSIGGSPYLQILSTYPDCCGHGPTGALLFAGSVYDHYSRGTDLTATDIAGIIADLITNNVLPQDPGGIYVLIASADVHSPSTGFCVAGARPHHGISMALGSQFRYAFLGNPMQCPSVAAPQFFSGSTQLPTPNGNFAADVMATTLANVLSSTITNPYGNGWYDRYGLTNSDKCEGEFGQTYSSANGARANLKVGGRDYLIQYNWVNFRKGRCAINQSEF